MTIKKMIQITFSYCLPLILITTLVGCSTPGKQKKIISVQKKRIGLLKKQIQRQKKVIGQLKDNKLIGQKRSTRQAPSPLRKMDKLIAEKKWVDALKFSSQLKQKYPRSIALKQRRYRIFNQMGLKKQAAKEFNDIRQLRAMKTNSKNRKL